MNPFSYLFGVNVKVNSFSLNHLGMRQYWKEAFI